MKTNIRYILLTALRDWLFAGLLFGVVVASVISGLMGDMAMVEPEQLKLTYAAASSRLVLVVGLVVFVCFHVRSAFDTREIDVFLSRPISRPNLVISYWLGFSVVALLLTLPSIGIVFWVGALDMKGFGIWALSLVLEMLMVVAAALFAAFTLRSAVSSVMATLGFYVLSRMMGFFIATSKSSLLFRDAGLNQFSEMAMQVLAIFVPRLDFFAKTEWLVYGVENMADIRLMVLQAVIIVPLLLMAAIIDFRNKQF